jgi:hypothetical protein
VAAFEAPRFHHLHLNSVDPEAAIEFYTRQFPSTSRTTWGGRAALASPNDVLILFDQVSEPPPIAPDTAIWHFGWHVPDSRAAVEAYRSRGEVELLPLFTGEGDGSVFVSSDTWPGAGGRLGRTVGEIAEARALGIEPTRRGGFAYLQGPDSAIVEYAGNHPAERFNHVHMWQEDPFCAEAWYEQHLLASRLPNALRPELGDDDCRVPRGEGRSFPSLERAGTYRTPSGGVAFGDVWLPWYMRQGDEPLAPTPGQLYDHIALGVSDLDAWIDKLREDGVTFLSEGTYPLGSTRGAMLSGPSREAIELVQTEY